MSSKARQQRDEWEVKMIGAHQSVLEICGETPVHKRSVTRNLQELENIWQKLTSIHAIYCRAANIGLSSQESTEFLKEKKRLREEAIKATEIALEVEDEDQVKVKRLKKTVEQLKTEVENTISTVEEFSAEEVLTREAHDEAIGMVVDATNKMNRYFDLNKEIEEILPEEPTTKAFNEKIVVAFQNHSKALPKLKLDLLKKAPQRPVVEQKPSVQVQDAPRQGDRVVSKQQIKLKPMECPTWDGKFKTFARFKKLWSENITPRHEDSALHFMLCQALPKHVLDNISTLTNSADEIWEYLEDKYGKPEVVAREVMSELMGLDSKKLGSKFITKFCTILLDTHTLLTSLGEEDWITSNRSVSELESKLPREEKLEWAKQLKTLPGGSKFEKFKAFLQQRKAVMEAMEGMGDMGDKAKDLCGYCSKPGHQEDKCFKKQRAENGSGKSFDGCAICGSSEHWKNECPDKGTDKDKRAGGGRGGYSNSSRGRGQNKGRGQGDKRGAGGSVGGDIGSNVLRSLECPRCKYSSKLTSCAGCKKTSNISHCLLHCPVFNAFSVEDKVRAVKDSKSCAVCLHPSHTTDKCDFKDKEKNICGMDGCSSHHHPSLHGSKDIFVTGVNVLLLQQVRAISREIPEDCVLITNILDRHQYVHDSYGTTDITGTVNKTQRETELDEIRAEMCKPLINGDKVLMVIMEVDVVHGVARKASKLVGFFDDGSNCSVIRTSLAEELGLWGDPVTLELGTVNATTVVETKLYCVCLLYTSPSPRDGLLSRMPSSA